MKKTFLLVGFLVLAVFLVLIFNLLNSFHAKPRYSSNSSDSNQLTNGTVTPSITSALKPIVINVSPANGSKNIPVSQQIIITFNRPFSLSDFTLAISPTITYSSQIRGNSLVITPLDGFEKGISYFFSVKYADGTTSNNYSFTTVGAPTITSTAPPDNIADYQKTWVKQNNPDIYLNGNAPYTTETFSVTSTYTDNPNPHFYFSVRLIGPDKNKSKQDFIIWAKSLGLTDSQISALDLRYQ